MPRLRSIAREVVELVPESVARENLVIPLSVDGETVTLATPNPNDIALADKLTFILARKIKLVAASPDEVASLIERHYGPARGGMASVSSMLQTLEDHDESDWSERHAPAALRSSAVVARAMGATKPKAPQQAPYATLPAGYDPTRPLGGSGVFTYVVEE